MQDIHILAFALEREKKEIISNKNSCVLSILIFHSVLSEYSPVLPRSREAVRVVVVDVAVFS